MLKFVSVKTCLEKFTTCLMFVYNNSHIKICTKLNEKVCKAGLIFIKPLLNIHQYIFKHQTNQKSCSAAIKTDTNIVKTVN